MINLIDLSGQTILVTGASSGIGQDTCILLSQLGARLILLSRDKKGLENSAAMLDGKGHIILPFDLKKYMNLPALLKDISSKTGVLSGAVHCAGVQSYLPIRFIAPQHLEEILQVNLSAAVFLAKGFRQKGTSKGGSIVFLSSISGIVGTAGQAAYSASKGAILALTRSLAMELAGEGIRVNCITPGVVQTNMFTKAKQTLTPEQIQKIKDMHPLGLGEPRDVATAIAFLLSNASRWTTGISLCIDGGYTAH